MRACTLRSHQGLQCSSNISVNTLGRCGRRIVTNEGDREEDREKGQDVGERSEGVERRTKRERERERVARLGEEDTKRPCAAEGARETTTTTTGTVSENRIRGEQVTGGREPVRVAGGGVSSFSTPVLPRTAQSGA